MSHTGRALFIFATMIFVAVIAVGCDNEVPDILLGVHPTGGVAVALARPALE